MAEVAIVEGDEEAKLAALVEDHAEHFTIGEPYVAECGLLELGQAEVAAYEVAVEEFDVG